uniref:BED-type domain-containing protein n=1 Tax=Amphimedon queenslandica TaxID=400682 RepID=A0A1X7U6A6_AMPQE
MSNRRSPIWQYFTANEGDKSAICTTCGTQVSRGGKSVKSFTTTNLVNHLKKHLAEYKEYEDAKRKEQLHATSTPSKPVLKQATLEESIGGCRPRHWGAMPRLRIEPETGSNVIFIN